MTHRCPLLGGPLFGGPLFSPEKSVKEVITWRHTYADTILATDFIYEIFDHVTQNSSNSWFSSTFKLFEYRSVTWSKISERKSVDQNRNGLHMPSRDYLLHTLFWTKSGPPSIHAILTKKYRNCSYRNWSRRVWFGSRWFCSDFICSIKIHFVFSQN